MSLNWYGQYHILIGWPRHDTESWPEEVPSFVCRQKVFPSNFLYSYSLFLKLSCLRASTGLNVCAWLWISSLSRGVTTLIAYSLQPVPFKVTGWSVMFPRSIFLGPFYFKVLIFATPWVVCHSLSGPNFFTWLYHEPLSGQFISASSIDWYPFGFIGLPRNLLH
jgi:hypothetical protein